MTEKYVSDLLLYLYAKHIKDISDEEDLVC